MSTNDDMRMQRANEEVDIANVCLTGRLDAMEAGGLRQQLSALIDAGHCNIAVDLSDVVFVDSAGLAALVKGMKDAATAGGDLRLVSPHNPDALRVFELTRFDRVFTMQTTLEQLRSNW